MFCSIYMLLEHKGREPDLAKKGNEYSSYVTIWYRNLF